MSGIARRRFVGLAGAALALPFCPAAAAEGGRAGFDPPKGPMLYTRSLRRVMVDGAAMGATRFYAVSFAPTSAGYLVEGAEAREPAVEAPPSLEAFAELERARKDNGMFPMELDPAGRILEHGVPADSPQLDAAVDEALHRIAGSASGANAQMEMRTFVLGLQQAAASVVAALPADLFNPVSVPLRERRAVSLPDGSTGEVELEYTARVDPRSGLMREAQRSVVTRLAESERLTIEHWTLAPA